MTTTPRQTVATCSDKVCSVSMHGVDLSGGSRYKALTLVVMLNTNLVQYCVVQLTNNVQDGPVIPFDEYLEALRYYNTIT
jgi:hypothetical protein